MEASLIAFRLHGYVWFSKSKHVKFMRLLVYVLKSLASKPKTDDKTTNCWLSGCRMLLPMSKLKMLQYPFSLLRDRV